jgi:hypothetical protein
MPRNVRAIWHALCQPQCRHCPVFTSRKQLPPAGSARATGEPGVSQRAIGSEQLRESLNQIRPTALTLVARSVQVHRHFRARAVLAFDPPKHIFLHGASIRMSAHTAYGPCRPARECIQ